MKSILKIIILYFVFCFLFLQQSESAVLNIGVQISSSVAMKIFNRLQTVRHKDFYAFLGLVQKCRDSDYCYGNSPGFNVRDHIFLLCMYGLTNRKGVPKKDVRNVVLSSVVGDASNLQIVAPFSS